MKKYDFLFLILFFILVILLSFPTAFANRPLSGRIIYLDPGHPEYSYTQDNEK